MRRCVQAHRAPNRSISPRIPVTSTLRAKLALSLATAAALLAAAPAHADETDELVSLINAWRAAPGNCQGRRVAPLPPLKVNPALGQMGISSSGDLSQALEEAGFRPRHSEAVAFSGVSDVHQVMDMLRRSYCHMALDERFSVIGTARSGSKWQILFAQPLLDKKLPDWKEAGKAILRAANAARATSRSCGGRTFPAAPPMKWNPVLSQAALEHSRDMAHEDNLTHQGSDGSTIGQRLTRAGYQWGLAGENIQAGVGSPEEAVAGWVASPGHCVNLMNPTFTEMGGAYAVDRERRGGNIYWTQVLSTPRR